MQRLRENGAEAFTKRELVELMLLFSSGKEDTGAEAASLFEYFGAFSEVLEASVMELSSGQGVSRNSAVLMSAIPQIARRIKVDGAVREKVVGKEGIRAFVSKCFIGRTVEHFLMLSLDKQMQMIRYDFISKGSVNNSTVDLRRMIQILLASNAEYAVIAHNHPRGNAVPSGEDLKTTRIIANALGHVNVKLLDHLIVNARECYSIADGPPDISKYLRSE